MDQKTKDQLKELLNIVVGAAAVGAEKTKDVAGKLAARGKEEWEASAPKRAELKAKIDDAKQKFLEKINKEKELNLTLDKIVDNLDKLSEEDLEKLKSILNSIN